MIEKQKLKGQGENVIKVGFCVAYDWPLLAYSIPLIYNGAHAICLSIDKGRYSWANRPFYWDESGFNALIRSLDTGSKIVVYEDDFHLRSLTPAANEVRQRRLMSERLGKGGWHIQLDCDEYFLDFDRFVDFLIAQRPRSYSFNVACQLVTIFKQVEGGYLYVKPECTDHFEFLQIASRTPCYEFGRRNGHFNILSDFLIVHQSWARPEAEILQKLSNWGHVNDFNTEGYFQFWRGVNQANFHEFRNLHPIQPATWPSLKYIPGNGASDLIGSFRKSSFPTLGRASRFWKSSIFISRLYSGIRRFLTWTFQ